MKIRLEQIEIQRAIELYLRTIYHPNMRAAVTLTSVAGKNYSDPAGFIIEADVDLIPPDAEKIHVA